MNMAPVGAENLSAQAQQAIRDLLLALIESKHFIGFQYASWCVCGPSVEADIALANMAQEEVGHAMVLSGLLGDDSERGVLNKDTLVTWNTWPAQSAESGSPKMIESWPEMIVTCLAREAAVSAALEALRLSSYARLAQRATKMIQEEQFHLMFGIETARTFGTMPREARLGLAADYQRALGEAEARLAAVEHLSRLSSLGVLGPEAGGVRAEYLHGVTQRLDAAWG
jgi:ring-1,2-phenylacetyl-CoA epoxidase subunit PaaC